MLNLIKESLEGTDYDSIKLDDIIFSSSEFFENVRGDFLVISDKNRKKIINLNAVKEITLLNRQGGKITAVTGLNL